MYDVIAETPQVYVTKAVSQGRIPALSYMLNDSQFLFIHSDDGRVCYVRT
jgi:hypothetical protein